MREMLKLGNKCRGILEPMAAQTSFTVSIRSYGQKSSVHWHDFAQLVLPLSGSLSIDIAGKQGLLDRRLAAYVETGRRHAQESHSANRSLILEFEGSELQSRLAERWARTPMLYLGNEINSLIDYMDLRLRIASPIDILPC